MEIKGETIVSRGDPSTNYGETRYEGNFTKKKKKKKKKKKLRDRERSKVEFAKKVEMMQ